MAIAFHMAEIDRFSTGRWFPKLDRIALWVVYAGEAPPVNPLGLGDDFDPAVSKFPEQSLEAIHSKIDHPLALFGEIVGIGTERREERRSSLLLPTCQNRRSRHPDGHNTSA